MNIAEPPHMIKIQEAVQSSARFLREIYQEEELEGVRVEEVELSEDSRHWLITLGFFMPSPATGHPLGSLAQLSSPERQYKSFRVRTSDGIIESMRIRTPE